MTKSKTAVIIGGSAGIGLEVGKSLAARGELVFLSSRDKDRAEAAAKTVGKDAKGIALDLSEPTQLTERLSHIGPVDHLVLTAIERDLNTVKGYDIPRAIRLVTLKLVGYTEIIHALAPRLAADASIVLFGGQARLRPYPGSITVTTVNGAVAALVGALATELAPVRVNAIHPGVVGDSPAWSGKTEATERARQRTPTGSLSTMADCANAVLFLLDNHSVSGVNLPVDGGWMLS